MTIYTITPDVINVDEFENFTHMFTVTADDLTPVVFDAIPIMPINDFTFTNLTNGSFSISGHYDTAFVRTLNYIDTNKQFQTTDAFSKLPTAYDTLYRYVAPLPATITKTYRVYFNNGQNISFDVIVRNNWQLANAHLTTEVAKGLY